MSGIDEAGINSKTQYGTKRYFQKTSRRQVLGGLSIGVVAAQAAPVLAQQSSTPANQLGTPSQEILNQSLKQNPVNQYPKPPFDVNETNSNTSESYQTPVDAEIRKTGVAAFCDAKPTAVPESGSSDQLAEGGGNQGTEKR